MDLKAWIDSLMICTTLSGRGFHRLTHLMENLFSGVQEAVGIQNINVMTSGEVGKDHY